MAYSIRNGMQDLRNIVRDLAESVAGEQGVEIFDVEIAGSSRRPLLRIYIDRKGGVTLEDCERFSRSLSALMDVEDPVRTHYVLEVSSPGLDRPLRIFSDYEENTGKLARIVTKEAVGNRTFFTGRILEAKDEMICLRIDEKTVVDIAFNNISKARLEPEWR